MANPAQLEKFHTETREIIEELLAEGSDPEALYLIEHHLCASERERLEQLAQEAFSMSFEVESEEDTVALDDGGTLFCCDLLVESPLDARLIDEQVRQVLDLAEKYQVDYDGWGTWFENGDESDDEEYEDEEDEDDDNLPYR